MANGNGVTRVSSLITAIVAVMVPLFAIAGWLWKIQSDVEMLEEVSRQQRKDIVCIRLMLANRENECLDLEITARR